MWSKCFNNFKPALLASEPTYRFEDRQCSGQGTGQVDNDQQNASQITKDRVA